MLADWHSWKYLAYFLSVCNLIRWLLRIKMLAPDFGQIILQLQTNKIRRRNKGFPFFIIVVACSFKMMCFYPQPPYP